MTPAARLTLPAATLALGACADAPSAPAASASAPQPHLAAANGALRFASDVLYSFEGDSHVQFTCADGTESEPVQLFGQVYERWTFTTTPGGRLHFLSSTMPVGLRGTGLVSGQEYRIVEREQVSGRAADDGSGGGSMHETWSLRARDSHATFGVTYLVQWKFGPDGELLVDRTKVRETCRP